MPGLFTLKVPTVYLPIVNRPTSLPDLFHHVRNAPGQCGFPMESSRCCFGGWAFHGPSRI